jgi:hypothetical protein
VLAIAIEPLVQQLVTYLQRLTSLDSNMGDGDPGAAMIMYGPCRRFNGSGRVMSEIWNLRKFESLKM